jgi:predicted Zn-dependent peptidase
MGTIATRILDCGMPLVVETMSGVRSVALSWLLPMGSASDPGNREGLSTLASEMILRGAGSRTSKQHADDTDRLGATRHADIGTFTMHIASTMLADRVRDVLPLIADVVRRPHLDDGALAASKDLALQALESLKDDPQERAMLLARLRHNPEPINRSGYGTREGLVATTREDVVSRWRELARPKRSVLALAGAVSMEDVRGQFNDMLAGWEGDAPEPVLGPIPARGYAHEHDETRQVQVIVAYDAPPEVSPDSVLERLAIGVLSGGMAGRLFTEVREKRGLCYSVSAGYRGDKAYGVVNAYVGTTPERAQESLDVLLAELRRILTREGRVTEDEFERAKIGMKSGLVFSGESTGARAAALAADQRRLGRARSLEEVAAEVERVTLDQLNAYLETRRMGKMTIQTLGPQELRVAE